MGPPTWHHESVSDQRGLNNGVQVALLFPVALGILLLTLQWAMLAWGEATALAAAQDGARAAAVIHGSDAAGETVAMAAADNGSLDSLAVTSDRGPRTTTVTVSGSVSGILPGFSTTIRRTAEMPTERLTRG